MRAEETSEDAVRLVKGTASCTKMLQSAQVSGALSGASNLMSIFSQSCALEQKAEAKKDCDFCCEFRLTCLQMRFQFSEEIKDSSLIAVLRFHQVGWEVEERMCFPLG